MTEAPRPAPCERVAEATAGIAPVHPCVVNTEVTDGAVLRGAHLVALEAVRRFVADGYDTARVCREAACARGIPRLVA